MEERYTGTIEATVLAIVEGATVLAGGSDEVGGAASLAGVVVTGAEFTTVGVAPQAASTNKVASTTNPFTPPVWRAAQSLAWLAGQAAVSKWSASRSSSAARRR